MIKALLVVVACLVIGGTGGLALSGAFIEGPQTIDLPPGTLVIPPEGDPYYYFENGSVAAQVFVIPADNADNLIAVVPVDIENLTYHEFLPVSVYVVGAENMEYWTDNHRILIEGWPDVITVSWPAEGPYEYDIGRVTRVWIGGVENRMVFTLRRW